MNHRMELRFKNKAIIKVPFSMRVLIHPITVMAIPSIAGIGMAFISPIYFFIGIFISLIIDIMALSDMIEWVEVEKII